MNPQEPIQAEDDEISLIDIILFLQASFSNVVKSLVVCFFAGGIYYFYIPKKYEAFATIEMARVAGEPVETPALLLEKMKLPSYFSPATLQACGTDGLLGSQAKFVDKIKPSINKSAPMLSFVAQAPSEQEAIACLNAVLADVSNYQDAIFKILLERKKQNVQHLSEQLKFTEETPQTFRAPKGNKNLTDEQFYVNALTMHFLATNASKVVDLRLEIFHLEQELIAPRTQVMSLFRPVYVVEISDNNRILSILGFCLSLGFFLGLFVSGVMRVAPEILRQIRQSESRTH